MTGLELSCVLLKVTADGDCELDDKFSIGVELDDKYRRELELGNK